MIILECAIDDAPAESWIHVTEVLVGREAQAECVSFQSGGSSGQATFLQRSRVVEGGSITWNVATLGPSDSHHDLQSHVAGEHGISVINWLFYALDRESYRLSARNIFDAASGTGEILMKGVAEEKGHVACNGLIQIGLGGGGTNTYLTQNVLMLDPTARVDVVPGLEIKTNDVKASHSATVSRVTEEDLFYFAARGIPRQEARGMFVRGFLDALADRVSDAETRDLIAGAIARKFERR
ncbi:MAG: FeS assembly protein SufD [Candidatus Peregrinibacteria bacterium Greene0416_19]|nr:MAG: FeS assembly protein SufD [Candidatus Peregrinibacteria bacterium Greene0416_19]